MSSSQILNYVSKLMPTFSRDLINDDAGVVETELKTNTIPAYKAAVETFNPRKVQSKEIQVLARGYTHRMGGNNAKGFVADIAFRLETVSQTVEVVRTAAAKDFETSIVIDGITLYKVSLIKSLELCGFISRYSLRLLNYLYILECAAANKNPGYVSEQISKGEIKELETHYDDFLRALKALSRNSKDFQRDLDALPLVSVGFQSEATLANVGTSKLDPMDLYAISGFISPVYRIGMLFAEFEVTRYKEAKELKTNLELRKIYLEQVRESGQGDPSTQKEIDIIQGRVDRCTERIRKEEQKVGM